MANTYFQFKKFTVHQQFTAMKVSTDACIFGATVAQRLADMEVEAPATIHTYLDIGTGTGLLSLMVAQKTIGDIDAVEMEEGAAEQAMQNINSSDFKERIQVIKNDILQFDPLKKYDEIFCNPPFYEDALHSPKAQINAAKHSTTLTLQQIAALVAKYLMEDGLFAVLLPYQRVNEFIELAAENNLFLSEKILVRHSINHTFFRGILFFKKMEVPVVNKTLLIRNEEGVYSDEFTLLLKDYYLNL